MEPRREDSGWERLFALVAFGLPLALALWRASATPQWRSDLASLRDQGLVVVGHGGSVSTVLTQLVGLLPLGSHTFRASVGSALALGVGSLLLFGIARRFLDREELPRPLAALLAAIGAVLSASSATWQVEGTVGGGALVAVALVLGGMELGCRLAARDALVLVPEATRRWLWWGVVAGLALAESVPAGLALVLVTAAMCITSGKRPAGKLMGWITLVALLTLAIASAPLLLRPLAPRGWHDVGRALSQSSIAALKLEAVRRTALSAWLGEIGVISLGLAGLGVVAQSFRERERAWAAALVALPLVDLLYPLSAAPGITADPLAPLRGLAVAALGIGAALGVAEVVMFLRRLEAPMARTAAILVVVFYVTVVAVTCEEASYAADRSHHTAAEEWTDLALDDLEPRAAILVHSPTLAWRLWAAQLLRGRRPDVIVIAAPLLRRGVVMEHLVPSEPNVSPLLRDMALLGTASEYSMSILADARPLHVELDGAWDERLLSHLSVEGAWLRYSPEGLGSSDRKPDAKHVLVTSERITRQLVLGLAGRDTPTASVVGRILKEHAAILSILGMSERAVALVDGVERLAGLDPFVVTARLRLELAARRRAGGSPVELRDLLRF